MFNDKLPFKFFVVHNCWYFFFLFLIHIFVLLIVDKTIGYHIDNKKIIFILNFL